MQIYENFKVNGNEDIKVNTDIVRLSCVYHRSYYIFNIWTKMDTFSNIIHHNIFCVYEYAFIGGTYGACMLVGSKY